MIRTFGSSVPKLGPGCFVETSAQVIGDVELGGESSVWFNSVIRGDVNPIRVGLRTNIQDLCMVHVLSGKFGTELGDDVTVGHQAVLHGCRVGSRVLVGMGARLLDGVEVGDDCLIAAGALLPPGLKIPAGSVVRGSPAKVVREVTPEERRWFVESAKSYVQHAQRYLSGASRPVE